MAKKPSSPLSGKMHMDVNKVPVIDLNSNPKGTFRNLKGSDPKTYQPPHSVIAAKRGHTNLPQDTAGYGTRQTGPTSKQKTR